MREQIQITQEQWVRVFRILHDQLEQTVVSTDDRGISHVLKEETPVRDMRPDIPEIIIDLCVKNEKYDTLAEAMQLFHEIGVEVKEDELL